MKIYIAYLLCLLAFSIEDGVASHVEDIIYDVLSPVQLLYYEEVCVKTTMKRIHCSYDDYKTCRIWDELQWRDCTDLIWRYSEEHEVLRRKESLAEKLKCEMIDCADKYYEL